MFDDLSAATSILPGDPGTWYEDGDTIPYLTRFRAKQARTLDWADLARWMKAPVVR